MTAGRRSRQAGISGPQSLIHRSNCSNPHGDSLSGRRHTLSYSIEWGVSEAVIEAAFLIAIKLQEGGYARPT
jgi:hypothetical protein